MDDEEFKKMSFQRKKKRNIPLDYELPQSYKELLPISIKKKDNLLSLFSKIDPDAREFYRNLLTVEMPEVDSNLDRLVEDEDE